MPLFDMGSGCTPCLSWITRHVFYHFCPGREAMGIIVASPSCTKYLWATLIVFCFRGW